MKKLFLALLTVAAIASCEKEKVRKGNLLITGNVEGLKEGTLFIQKLQDTVLVNIDTIKISGDSKFESDLTISSPEMYYLHLDRGTSTNIDDNLMFFAEPGKIEISTTLENFYAKAKVSGSKNHDLFEKFRKIDQRYAGEQLDLTAEQLNSIRENKPFSIEEAQKKSEMIDKRRALHAVNFAMNHRDHEVSPYIALSEITETGTQYLDTISRSMTPKVASSKYGKLLRKLVEAK